MGRVKDLTDIDNTLVDSDYFLLDNNNGSYKINFLTLSNNVVNKRQTSIEGIVKNNSLINLDTTAESGTPDGNLYAAIVALGWESEVIE